MGSRVRITAAACVVASGLLVGGASASLAFADSLPSDGDSGNKHTDPVGIGSYEIPKSGPDEKKTTPVVDGKEEQPGTDPAGPKPGDEKDGDNGIGRDGDNGGTKNGDNNNGDNGTGNPGNGNCGNSGGNGNASGCGGGGGGNGDPDPEDPPTTNTPTPPTKPTPPPTETTKPPPPPDPEEPGGCDDKKKDDCSPGWPWWPWPWPRDLGQPPVPGGGGGGGAVEVPSGRPELPPQMQLPPELMPPATEPVEPSVIDVVPGVGVAAAELPIAPITLPVIVAPAAGLGGGGGPGAPGSPALPGSPRGVTAQAPTGRSPLPANVGSNVALPASSYRIGYPEYLRTAGLSQVVALAAPGIAGMLVLTGAGGLVGYRQAKAGHAIHTSGTARFVN